MTVKRVKKGCKCGEEKDKNKLILEKYFDFLLNFAEKNDGKLEYFINFDQEHNCISFSAESIVSEENYVDEEKNKKIEDLEVQVKAKVDTSEIDGALEKMEELKESKINSVEQLKECIFRLAWLCDGNGIIDVSLDISKEEISNVTASCILKKYGLKEEYERRLKE